MLSDESPSPINIPSLRPKMNERMQHQVSYNYKIILLDFLNLLPESQLSPFELNCWTLKLQFERSHFSVSLGFIIDNLELRLK